MKSNIEITIPTEELMQEFNKFIASKYLNHDVELTKKITQEKLETGFTRLTISEAFV